MSISIESNEQKMRERLREMTDLQESGAKRVSFVGSCRMSDGVPQVAASVSKVLGIDNTTRANS